MRVWLSLAVQLAALAVGALAKSATGNSVLVVLEQELPKEDFSTFFSGLEGTSLVLEERNTI